MLGFSDVTLRRNLALQVDRARAGVLGQGGVGGGTVIMFRHAVGGGIVLRHFSLHLLVVARAPSGALGRSKASVSL